MAAPKPPKPPRIQALARASAIVDVIAAGDEEGVGLSDISRATALNKTTAFNLLASLVTLRFIDQDVQSRRYRLGLRNLELGRIVQQRLHISQLARPVLAELGRKTNETVNLGLPDLLDLMVVESVRGSRFLHAAAYAGWRSHYHCTALGKAFMAQWEQPSRQTIYDSCGLPAHTPKTITDVDTLEAHLDRCRSQGYTLDLEENEVGVNGIARWIFNGLGEVAAAISVAGPAHRMTEEYMQGISTDVITAADSISALIGGDDRSDRQASSARQ